MTTIKEITQKIKQFTDERNWEQYHSPKSLAMSVAIEAAEVMEHFQWLTTEEAGQYGKDHQREVGEELADVAIYLFELARVLDIDLASAILAKMEKNAIRYPREIKTTL